MSFLSTLSFHDLQTLREVVRKVFMANFADRHITTRECDKMIDAFGEETLQKHIRALVDGRGRAGVDGVSLVPDDRPDGDERQKFLDRVRVGL